MQPRAGSSDSSRSLFWPAVVLLAAVFFFLEHDVRVSQYEAYTPWTDTAGSLENGRNAAKGLALGLLGIIGGWMLLRSRGREVHLNGSLPLLALCYLAWLGTTLLWSLDPGMSGRRLIALLCCLATAAGFAAAFRARDIPLIAVAIGTAYLAVGLAVELALGTFRPWLPEYRFAGTIHPNAQGVQLAALCLGSLCLLHATPERRKPLWLCLGVGVAFLLLTKSRASCASLVVAVAAIWFVAASARARVLAALIGGLAVCLLALAASMFSAEPNDRLLGAMMLGRQEQSEGLTGRVPLWLELARYIRERPLEGYGYQAFWTDKQIESVSEEMEWTMREAHNGYLETVLSGGLVGGVILLAIVALGLVRAAGRYRATGDPGIAFVVGLLAFCIADACFESGVPNFVAVLAEMGFALLMLASPSQCGNNEKFLRPGDAAPAIVLP
ncbi:MAG: O-antigen ligase family protein [Planctomycetaceae bacterium]|nr:O-antigen ligase family protein [Planctomycetaceae bacterium]